MLSPLQLERQRFVVPLPATLQASATVLRQGAVLAPPSDAETIASLFPCTFGAPSVHIEAAPSAAAAAPAARPLRVGAVLSGGQAPGGHNVLSGIYDGIKRVHPDSVFLGFLDGPRGLFEGKYVEIDEAMMQRYRNMGGFDAIGSGRDKIETPEQFAGARAWADKLALDGVVIIGGDDSNTNGAVLAEYFKANGCNTKVVGAPKVRGRLGVAPWPAPRPPPRRPLTVTSRSPATWTCPLALTLPAARTLSSLATCAWTCCPRASTGTLCA